LDAAEISRLQKSGPGNCAGNIKIAKEKSSNIEKEEAEGFRWQVPGRDSHKEGK